MGHVFAYVFERFVREGEREGVDICATVATASLCFCGTWAAVTRGGGGRSAKREREDQTIDDRRSNCFFVCPFFAHGLLLPSF